METEGSPKVLSFRYHINVNTQNSDLIMSNQRNLESAKSPFQRESNKKIQQLIEGLCSESTDRNNQDSTSNTSCISNLSPLKVKSVPKDIDSQFTFVSQDESLNSSSIPKQQHSRSNTRLNIPNKNTLRKPSTSSIKEKIYEEKYCGLCNQADQYSNFIRPCLCKDKQHLHQQCVQEALQQIYMDEQKLKFIKPIICEKCKFKFIIKSYKLIDFAKAFQDPLKHRKILIFLLAILTLILILGTFVVVSILNRETLEQKSEYIVATIVSSMIILAFILFIYKMMIEYISNYKWLILDREQAKVSDQGVRMNHETLNQLLEYQRKKESELQEKMKKNKNTQIEIPQKEIELIIQ